MKVPLIVGFLALLALFDVDHVLTDRTLARLERDLERIRDLQPVRVKPEALEHLAKPIDAGMLLSKVAELLSHR